MNILPPGKLPNDLLKSLLTSIELDDDVIVGPGVGRDAAAVRVGDQVLVLKTDPITFPTSSPGAYLVNINANDIACMGADPRWLLVTVLLPQDRTTPELVSSIFEDLRESCAQIGCTLVGGHTEVTEGIDRPILVGQMIGLTTEQSLVDARQAQPGDAVMLAGGIAIEGTSILATERASQLASTIDPDLLDRGSSFIEDPGISVLPYARALRACEHLRIKAMHDPTEGGLATGLYELAETTECGISINSDAVRIYPETRAIAGALGLDPWGLIASGALLFVVDQADVQHAIDALRGTGAPARQIGSLTASQSERTLIVDGQPTRIPEFKVDEIARYFAS